MPKHGYTGVRLEQNLLDRVAEFARQVEIGNPGIEVSRSEAIRILLTYALDQNRVPKVVLPPQAPVV